MNRRTILKVVAGSLVVVAGGAGTFLATRDPAAARKPWADAVREDDHRIFALRHAILAPNPHNRQPWIVALEGGDRAKLYIDLDRRLPFTDPFDRQLVIGFGCFIELASIAAAQRGYRMDVSVFPEGEPQPRLDERPIAELSFVKDAGIADKLFAQIAKRRSTKEPFDLSRSVADGDLATLAAMTGEGLIVGATNSGEVVDSLRTLTWDAWMTETNGRETYKESVDLMRIGKAEIEASPDGIDLGGAFLDTLALLGQLDRKQLADPATQAYQAGVDLYREIMATSMAFLWIVSDTNTRATQLAAGRLHARLNLEATRLGLAFHPVSQALQEYEAMVPHHEGLHRMLAIDSPSRIQMLVRLGHRTEAVPPAPRWPLEAKLRTA